MPPDTERSYARHLWQPAALSMSSPPICLLLNPAPTASPPDAEPHWPVRARHVAVAVWMPSCLSAHHHRMDGLLMLAPRAHLLGGGAGSGAGGSGSGDSTHTHTHTCTRAVSLTLGRTHSLTLGRTHSLTCRSPPPTRPTLAQDIVCRYAHQTGHHVPRRFGWDCHGVMAFGASSAGAIFQHPRSSPLLSSPLISTPFVSREGSCPSSLRSTRSSASAAARTCSRWASPNTMLSGAVLTRCAARVCVCVYARVHVALVSARLRSSQLLLLPAHSSPQPLSPRRQPCHRDALFQGMGADGHAYRPLDLV